MNRRPPASVSRSPAAPEPHALTRSSPDTARGSVISIRTGHGSASPLILSISDHGKRGEARRGEADHLDAGSSAEALSALAPEPHALTRFGTGSGLVY